MVIPGWVVLPFAYLGLFFILYKPLFGASWNLYFAPLVGVVASALVLRNRYRHVILRRDERGIIAWIKWGPGARLAEPPKVVFQDAPGAYPPEVAEPSATKFDDLFRRGMITRAEYERLLQGATTPATQSCPDCAETVLAGARVCRYCHYRFDQATA